MKSPSIDLLYIQLNKHILLAQSYTEIKQLEFIIKSCRLKPYTYMFEGKDKTLVLHRWWFDEFGNSFKIDKKKIKIIYNDLSLNREKIICTDLYSGFSMNKIAKISKLVYICAGKDDDLYNEYFIVTFLGIDNYLRSFMYLHNEWQQISPLLLGMKVLKTIARNSGMTTGFKALKNKNIPSCINSEAWLTSLPVSDIFLELVTKRCETLNNIF
jgi:hypothetical protein